MEKLKILIVEDEAMTALLFQKKFERAGFNVCQLAANGEKAINIAKKENPDLILMDVDLSGEMDGIETSFNIKKIKNIPIIFITGYSDEDLKQQIAELDPNIKLKIY